jgi:hypothetical protein
MLVVRVDRGLLASDLGRSMRKKAWGTGGTGHETGNDEVA